jgi:hypothetical protein
MGRFFVVTNKRTTPELRKRLTEIAVEQGIEELKDIADELQRNPAAKRAPRKSRTFTAEMAEEVRAFAQKNPDMHNQEIADRFGVNPGRISEAINNRR